MNYFSSDSSNIIQNASNILSFSVNDTNQSDTQCFNISTDFSEKNPCNYCDVVIESQILKTSESDHVAIINGTAELVVTLPEDCVCEESTSTSSDISDAVIAVISLSILLFILITLIFVVIIIYFRKSARNQS